MSIVGGLFSFALRYVFNESADRVIGAIEKRLTDHSQALPKALAKANDRAWEAVGLALAGDGLFDRVRDVFRDADVKGVRDQIKKFLDQTPTGLETIPAANRVKATEEWSRLRKVGRFAVATIPAVELARRAATIERHGDPAGLTAAAHHAVRDTSEAIRVDAPHLAALLTAAPPGGTPLLAAAFAFFFRREIETNAELAHGLSFDYLRQISERQEQGLNLLDLRTAGILGQLDVLFDALEKSFAALSGQVEAGFAGMGEKLDDQANVIRRIEKRLAEPRKPGVSYETYAERQFLRQAQAEFRRNPGRVGVAAASQLGDALNAAHLYGDAGEAHVTAATTARVARDTVAEAINRHKAYLDYCAAGAWERAATELWAAVELDPARYLPFNTRRYAPVRILGGGAFGTVFLCHDQYNPDPDTGELLPVAIKTLRAEAMSRELSKVLAEAIALKALKHPNIISILDQDFADHERTRPYLVLEYFPGDTLETWLRTHGPLPAADVLQIAKQVAGAVHAAHSRSKPVFHRDLKPANIMVMKHADGTWTVKVIDFGLAVRGGAALASRNIPEALRSTADTVVAGTIKYAPPEQLGDLPDVEVGPYSDVYAFGKTCHELLFGHTNPQDEEWEVVPEPIRPLVKKLFSNCVRHALSGKYPRFLTFEPAIAELTALDATARTNRERLEREAAEMSRIVAERLAQEERNKRNAAAAECTSEPKAGDEREFEIAKDVRMKFCWVPAGEAQLGSTQAERKAVLKHLIDAKSSFVTDGKESAHLASEAENIRGKFKTKGFWLGKYEVQQSEWEGVMEENPSQFKGAKLPVETVSWEDCQKFIEKCGVKGMKMKLPHEDEWEYACRGGKGKKQAFYWGNVLNGDKANCDRKHPYGTDAKVNSNEKTTEIGSYENVAPHPWGLCDMSGNVWERCENLYTTYGSDLVVRGGSWYSVAWDCRTAYRHSRAPTARRNSIGFRLALVPEFRWSGSSQERDRSGARKETDGA